MNRKIPRTWTLNLSITFQNGPLGDADRDPKIWWVVYIQGSEPVITPRTRLHVVLLVFCFGVVEFLRRGTNQRCNVGEILVHVRLVRKKRFLPDLLRFLSFFPLPLGVEKDLGPKLVSCCVVY